MAKIATVHLVVNEDDEARITDGLNDALRRITHPMGNGVAEASVIIDYSLQGKIQGVAPEIEESISTGTYVVNSAAPQVAYFAVVIEGDVSAFKLGPFANAAERDEAARRHRAEFGSDDGIHTLEVHPDGSVEVGDYSGNELEESNELIERIHAALHSGGSPIRRQSNDKQFTVESEGAEVPFTYNMVVQLEGYLDDHLVVLVDGPNEILLPKSSVRARVDKAEWTAAVTNDETETSFHQWREHVIDRLPIAREVYENEDLA